MLVKCCGGQRGHTAALIPHERHTLGSLFHDVTLRTTKRGRYSHPHFTQDRTVTREILAHNTNAQES